MMHPIFSSLLDLQFTRMVTPRLAPLVYLISIVMSAITAFGMMFRMGFWGFLLGIIWFIASVILARVAIEVALSIFQIAKYTQETARQGRPARLPANPAESPGTSPNKT